VNGKSGVLKGHTEIITCLALHPDGKRVISGSRDGTLRVWDLASGKSRVLEEGHAYVITCLALHPDGNRVISGSNDGTLRVWTS